MARIVKTMVFPYWIFNVTQIKDGCVYKTEKMPFVVHLTISERQWLESQGVIVGSVSFTEGYHAYLDMRVEY